MDVLDEKNSISERNEDVFLNQGQIWVFSLLLLAGIYIMGDAIYAEYEYKRITENTSIIVCFYSSYMWRPYLELFAGIGVIFSLYVLYKNKWCIPSNDVHKTLLLSPILLFILDYLLVSYLY